MTTFKVQKNGNMIRIFVNVFSSPRLGMRSAKRINFLCKIVKYFSYFTDFDKKLEIFVLESYCIR